MYENLFDGDDKMYLALGSKTGRTSLVLLYLNPLISEHKKQQSTWQKHTIFSFFLETKFRGKCYYLNINIKI